MFGTSHFEVKWSGCASFIIHVMFGFFHVHYFRVMVLGVEHNVIYYVVFLRGGNFTVQP